MENASLQPYSLLSPWLLSPAPANLVTCEMSCSSSDNNIT